MKPPPFDYAAPESVAEAVGLLAAEGDTKALAGGQSLVPLLSMRLAFPDLLVDLRRIEALGGISATDDRLVVGAMVRQREAETSPEVARHCPLLASALRHIAHPQIRSRGTVGGSIAHADPAAELPAVALALDAEVRATGPGGERRVAAAELYRGMLTTSLADDELVTAVEFPPAPPGSGSACVEVARRSGDYAICGAVAQLTAADGVVAEARLALFGIADRPVRASAAEAALAGAPLNEAAGLAAGTATEGIAVSGEADVPVDYRRHVAAVVAGRAIGQSLERLG